MSTPTLDLILYGAGGIGREIVSMAESGCHAGRDTHMWRVIGFVDDHPEYKGTMIHGVPCFGNLPEAVAARAGQETWCHIAIGDNAERYKAAKRVADAGWKAATVIHMSAYVSWEIEMGEGSFVGPHVTISPNVIIGPHTLINTRACIGHHATLGAFSQLSLGASILGHGHIKRGSMVGAHSVVMAGVTVGAWATVAIGTPVLMDVKPGHTICLPLARTIYKRSTFPDEDGV